MEAVPLEERFEGHYVEWREKRIAAIEDHYGRDWFAGKSVLEVGAGFGDIGVHFAKIGARVTCSDARQSHVKEARRRHPDLAQVFQADIDQPYESLGVNHDLLLHLGVLYHLKDPEEGVRRALAAARHVVLETEVADSDDPELVVVTEERGYDQAYNAVGSRPSPALIERVMRESGRSFTRVADARCNSGPHRYDWHVTNSGAWEDGLRAMWFVAPVD